MNEGVDLTRLISTRLQNIAHLNTVRADGIDTRVGRLIQCVLPAISPSDAAAYSPSMRSLPISSNIYALQYQLMTRICGTFF